MKIIEKLKQTFSRSRGYYKVLFYYVLVLIGGIIISSILFEEGLSTWISYVLIFLLVPLGLIYEFLYITNLKILRDKKTLLKIKSSSNINISKTKKIVIGLLAIIFFVVIVKTLTIPNITHTLSSIFHGDTSVKAVYTVEEHGNRLFGWKTDIQITEDVIGSFDKTLSSFLFLQSHRPVDGETYFFHYLPDLKGPKNWHNWILDYYRVDEEGNRLDRDGNIVPGFQVPIDEYLDQNKRHAEGLL